VLARALALWLPSVTIVDGDEASLVMVVLLTVSDVLELLVLVLACVSRELSRLESIDETDTANSC
jgi:hypothetical protein